MQPQMLTPDADGIYARLDISQPRRWLAVLMHALLGGLVIASALAVQPAWHWLIVLCLIGAELIWEGEKLRRATTRHLLLTETDLRDSDGTVLIALSNITRIDRGAFSIKPAHGFSLISKNGMSRGRAPGLWWRYGRRLGIGGVVNSGQAKFMAEQLARLIA